MGNKKQIGEEFQGDGIKDRRIMKRLKMAGEQLSKYPSMSIPQAFKGLAEIKGAYRLFDNKKVTPEGILSGHKKTTMGRIGKHEIILLVQDTTTLNYASHPCVEGLGLHSTSPDSLGLLLHSTLAVTTRGVPLGLMSQKYWTRSVEERGKKHARKEKSIEDKESYRWLETLEETTKNIPENVTAVTVADREADIYDFIKKSNDIGQDILIRAVGGRLVDDEEKKLLETMEASASAGEVTVVVPRNAKEKIDEREVRLDIKFRSLYINPPQHRMKDKTLHPVELYAVYAREIDPLDDRSAIQWLLLTSLPVNSLMDAVEKLNWYKHRWKIERFHYTLKSGCKVEELQLETIDRLKNALTLYSIIAWKLVWLTYENRENPDASCETVLDDHEWKSLCCVINQSPKPPEHAPTIKEAVRMIARLGGFMGRKSDGNPGTKVLWRGLQRVNDFAAAWLIIYPLATVIDVGNE